MTEPSPKKLKSVSDPDLKILIGDKFFGEEEVHYYHSVVMAHHSNYIDTMLASPMKESQSHEIHFPDIEPKTWKKMMD